MRASPNARSHRHCLQPRRFSLAVLLAFLGSVLLLCAILQIPGNAIVSRRNKEDPELLHSHCFDKSEEPPQLIFMLIDAWKYDFLASDSSPMDFLKSRISQGQGVMMRANVQVPTVTEPRIKALTGGVNPSFASILSNFFTSTMMSDTWLSKARSSGKRLIFYGDDTWLKLFPEYFSDFLGVPSFNVLDYTDVDNHVTQKMREKIHAEDWDIMILHYLGLDHIGHSLGGESPEIPRKLGEMDNLAKEMFTSVRKSRNLTLVIVGDHGMTVQGSHGGSHISETQTPLVLLSTGAVFREKKEIPEVPTISQVDVVSLLSLLLRQPLPGASVGISVVPHLHRYWSLGENEILLDFLLQLQRWQTLAPGNSRLFYLADVVKKFNGSCEELYRTIDSRMLDDFYFETRRIQDEFLSKGDQIGGYSYALGLGLLLTAALLAVSSEVVSIPSWDHIFVVLPIVSIVSSSFIEEEHEVWYYCASGAVALLLWRSPRVPECLMILFLHRFSSSASARLRRRWTMHPDLLPGLLWEDSSYFEPLRTAGTWLETVIFPTTAEWSSVGGVYTFILVVLMKYTNSARSSWVSFSLQITIGFCRLFNCQELYSTVIYISSWAWLFLLPFSTKSAVMLLITCIGKPAYFPVFISTYVMGIAGKKISLSRAAVACLLNSSLFYTGLSNSISSIDIKSGYGGFLAANEYHPLIVGIQIVLNLYAPFLCFLLGYGQSIEVKSILKYITMIRILILCSSASLLIQFTGHLFIWTVFVPKVLFDVFHLFLLLLYVVLENTYAIFSEFGKLINLSL